MRKKSVLSVLICCIVFLFAGCSAEKGDVRSLLQNGVGHFSLFAENVLKSISVQSFSDTYARLKEPQYIDWQTSRLYYENLNETEKLAYRCIYNNIFGQPERIAVPLLEDGELDRLYTALRNDNPQLLFLGEKASLLTAGISCYFVPTYSMDYWQAREAVTDSAAAARAVLQNLPQNADDFEKLLYVHDAVCEMCVYGDNGNASNCSGVLLDHTATCAGYSKALKLMLDMLGIPSCTVTGNASDEESGTVSHMWLAVCIDNQWSFCDPTWDDPVSEDGRQVVEHSYFGLTREQLSMTHSDITMPDTIVCDSETANYYVRRNLCCTDDAYADVLLAGMQLALSEGRPTAEFRFADDALFEQACRELFEDDTIYALLQQAQLTNESLAADRISYSTDDKHLYLKLNFVFDE